MFGVFGRKVKELREENGLSRKAVAEHFGLKQNAIYEWENRGKQPDYETLCKIADFFDVSVDYLLGRED